MKTVARKVRPFHSVHMSQLKAAVNASGDILFRKLSNALFFSSCNLTCVTSKACDNGKSLRRGLERAEMNAFCRSQRGKVQ